MKKMVDMAVYAAYEAVKRNTIHQWVFLFSRKTSWKTMLSEDGTPPWLTQEEFLEKYGIHRYSFHSLVD